MFYVYVLESGRNGRYYIGHTNSLDRRLQRHNEGRVRSTRNLRPLRLVYREAYEDGKTARQREYWLKAQKSRRLVQELIRSAGVGP